MRRHSAVYLAAHLLSELLELFLTYYTGIAKPAAVRLDACARELL